MALVVALTAFAPMAMAADDKFATTDARGKIGWGALTTVTDNHTIMAAHTEMLVTGYEEVNGEMHAIGMVTADGSTHITTIVDLDEDKVLHVYDHPEWGGYGYYGVSLPDGRMVMAHTSGSYSVYDPAKKEFKMLGKIVTYSSKGAFCGLVYDEERDTLFSSEHTRGMINATNATTGLNTVVVSMQDHFLRGGMIAQTKDYLYTSGTTKESHLSQTLYKIHKDTGVYEIIPNPEGIGLVNSWTYTTNVGSKYMITQASLTGGGTQFWAYDLENEKWIEMDNEKYSITTSRVHEGLETNQRLFKNGKTGRLCTIDENLNITDTGISYGSHVRGNGRWIELKDPTMPGLNVVTAQFDGGIYIWNLETGKTKKMTVMIPGPSVPHRISYYDYMNGLVWVGGYKAGTIAAVDVKTGESHLVPGDQPEGMIVDPATSLFYHGDYSGAHIREKDPSKEWPADRYATGARGETVDYYMGSIGQKQDRPFDLEVIGRELWVATMPSVGSKTSGALSVFNLDTMEKQVFRGILPGQSVLTCAPAGKYAFIGGSVTVGGGDPVSPEPAMIAKVNVETKEVEKLINVKLPGVNGRIAAVHALDLSPDGTKLYASGTGFYAIYDPETLELLKYNIYGTLNVNLSAGAQAWHSQRLYFEPKTGYILHGDSYGGRVIDPDTLDIVLEKPGYGWFCGFDEDYNAYFVSGTQVFKAPLIIGEDKRYLVSGISFFKTGEDIMYQSGDKKDFKTYEENGRVMVPLRNAATSMGGVVAWDQKTNTATVTNAAGKKLSFNTGDNIVKFDGKGKMFGVYLKVINGVTYIPMQTLCDFLEVELVEARGINFITKAGSNYKPSGEVLDYIESEVYSK